MSLIKVKEDLKKYHLDNRIIEFPISSATVKDASIALNCNEERIAKTLAFYVNNNPILIVMAGDVKIDNAKYKAYFKVKSKMIPIDEVEQVIGHPVGGVCPFGIKENISVFLDKSLKRFQTIFPACGSSNSAIELSIEELEKTSNYKEWVDVSKK
jgi:prolyl-tRNA editing enzyme YbaK/EbsC (Cys-tRNA(Pro) deacylase)